MSIIGRILARLGLLLRRLCPAPPVVHAGFNDAAEASGSDLLAAFGPTVLVDIGWDEHYVPGSTAIPVPSRKGVEALIDTGAVGCAIDARLAAELGLPKVGRRVVSGAGGPTEVDMYSAQIRVPSLNCISAAPTPAFGLAAGGHRHAAVLGRAFLQQHRIVYDGQTGTVTLAAF